MKDTPDTLELLESVCGFLDSLRDELDGHRAFHARVAANVLEIVAREIAQGEGRRREEQAELESLLGRDGDVDTLTVELCQAIRDGRLATDDPQLLDFLDRSTLRRLDVDQPGYSGARIAREG